MEETVDTRVHDDLNLSGDRTVPAGTSLDVPLDFEGSPVASVVVYAADAGVTATFGGTALVEKNTGLGRALTAELTNPVDGTLRVTNANGTAASISISVVIRTGRHLTVSAPTRSPAPGSPVGFTVTLSASVPGDAVQAELVDPAGGHTPISLTATASGEWTGEATPTTGGAHTIQAWTTTNGIRYAAARLDVASGSVTLGSTFSERTVDDNSNGLADELVLSPTVTIGQAGRYAIDATLVDPSGAYVASILSNPDDPTGWWTLPATSGPIDLRFDGATIYKSGKSGPYRLTNVRISRLIDEQLHLEASLDTLGPTAAYDYRAFEHQAVVLSREGFGATGLDPDNDGFFEALQLTGEVSVERPGTYRAIARLVSSTGITISNVQASRAAVVGPNTFSFTVSGATIWNSGLDGPYRLVDVTVFDDSGRALDTVADALHTQLMRSQFPPLPTSHASALPPTTTTPTINLPFTVTDWTGTEGASVTLYQRFTGRDGVTGRYEAVATTTDLAAPFVVTLAADGRYEFYTIATDGAGNVEQGKSTPETWTVRNPSAEVALTFAGPLPARVNSTELDVSYTVETGGELISRVDLLGRYWSPDSNAWMPWAIVGSGTTSPIRAHLANVETRYEFYTRAVTITSINEPDPAQADAWTILDTRIPSSSATGVPVAVRDAALSVPFTVEDESGTGIAFVRLYQRFTALDGRIEDWADVATVTSSPIDITLDRGEGTYQFYTLATDCAGNTETPPIAYWMGIPTGIAPDATVSYDITRPTSILARIAADTATIHLSLGFSASDNTNGSGIGTVELWQRFTPVGGSLEGWVLVTTGTTSPFNLILGRGNGLYEFTTIAVDRAGNREADPPGPSTVPKASTTLNAVPPTSSVGTIPAAVKSTTLSVPFTMGGASVSVDLYRRYTIPGGTPTGQYTPIVTGATTSPIPVSLDAGDGTYEFYTIGVAADGVEEAAPASADATTILDTAVPSSSITTTLPAGVPDTALSIAYTASDNPNGSGIDRVELWWRHTTPSGTVDVNWSKTLTVTAASGSFTAFLNKGNGLYEFYTVAYDEAGNAEPATQVARASTTLTAGPPTSHAGPLPATLRGATSQPIPITVGGGTVTIELYKRFTPAGATPDPAGWSKINTLTSLNPPTVYVSGAGTHEFYTIGIDAQGNRESKAQAAEATIVLDSAPPVSIIETVPAATNATTLTLPYTITLDTGTAWTSIELHRRVYAPGGALLEDWRTVDTIANPSSTGSFAASLDLGDGTYQFFTITRDAAGNVEGAPYYPPYDRQIVLDRVVPTSAVTAFSPAATKNGSVDVNFSASDNANGSGLSSVSLYRRFTATTGTVDPWVFVSSMTTTGNGRFTAVALPNGEGRYEFYTVALDKAGNAQRPEPTESTVGDTAIVRDTTVPDSIATTTSPPFVKTTAVTIGYAVTDTSAPNTSAPLKTIALWRRFQSPGSTSWGIWSSVTTLTTSAPTGTFTGVSLPNTAGTYEFTTVATDTANNVEPNPTSSTSGDISIVLDLTAPTSTVSAPAATATGSSIDVAYTASDNTNGSGLTTLECWTRYRTNDSTAGGEWTLASSSATTSGACTVSFGSGAGIYELLTVAVDRAGNREAGAANPPAATATPKTSVRAVAWLASVKLNGDTGAALQDDVSFALGPDGTLYAVWSDSRNGDSDIYFSSRDPATGVWSAQTKVNSGTDSASQRTPAIAVDGSDNVYVVWADDRNASTGTDIYFAKRTGTTWSADAKVNDDTAAAVQDQPRISVTSAGVAVTVWVDRRSSQNNIYSSRLTGGSWSANMKVTSNTSAIKSAPDIAMDASGASYAVWQDRQSNAGDIYFATLTSSGTSWSSNSRIDDDSLSSGVDSAPRVGLASNGNVLVTWIDGRTTPSQIRVRQRTGTSWSASIRLDASAMPSADLVLAVKAGGGVIVAWSDTRTGTSAIWGVQCEASTSGVTRCSAGEQWSDQTGASFRPALVADGTKVYLGWRDDTAGNGDIRWRARQPS